MAEVFVLGHRGMLGHVVARVLRERGHTVRTSDERYEPADHAPLVEAVRGSGCPWIVNALGAIKQKTAEWSRLLASNALFPVHLRARLDATQRLIHASTDCVFAGERGAYRALDRTDATDVYGLSKILGERVASSRSTLVLRTSIVGPELGTNFGLMSWLFERRGTVPGFSNHRWNGITTLDWAKLAFELVEGSRAWRDGIVHVGSAAPVTKHELLSAISARWALPVVIEPVATGRAVDRTLDSDWVREPIESQLDELRGWTCERLR